MSTCGRPLFRLSLPSTFFPLVRPLDRLPSLFFILVRLFVFRPPFPSTALHSHPPNYDIRKVAPFPSLLLFLLPSFFLTAITRYRRQARKLTHAKRDVAAVPSATLLVARPDSYGGTNSMLPSEFSQVVHISKFMFPSGRVRRLFFGVFR